MGRRVCGKGQWEGFVLCCVVLCCVCAHLVIYRFWVSHLAIYPYRVSLCCNQDSDLAARRDGYVEISCTDPSCFKSWPASELAVMVDTLGDANARVVAGTMGVGKYKELSQSIGLNWNPDGLIADLRLRPHVDPIGVMTYDWVHNMLQDGVFGAEARAFIKACEPLGISRAHVQTFLKDEAWMFPMFAKGKAKQLHRVFDVNRISADQPDKIKASCSELLGLYGLLRHFFELHVRDGGAVQAEYRSFLAACEVLDLILITKRCTADVVQAANRLAVAASEHLRLHIVAYGTVHVKPKHHWTLDVPAQILRDGCVLDAFIIERTHLLVKSIAEHVRNTSGYERSVLSGVLSRDFKTAEATSLGDSLLGKVADLPGHPGIRVADKMAIFTFEVSVDDVILRGDSAGIVVACVLESGRLMAVVNLMVQVGVISGHTRAFQPTGSSDVWLASEIAHCIAWYCKPDGSIVVIRM